MKIGIKNKSLIRFLRTLSQLLCFIFLPGLYISVFGDFKLLYVSILHLNLQASTLLIPLLEILAVIPVTMLAGRLFCGWMCAFGAMGDFLYFLPSNFFKHRPKISEKADRILKYFKYVLLLFLIIAGWSFNITSLNAASPWDAFGMLFTVGKLPEFSYVLSNLLIGFLLLIFIMAASLLIDRFFCRYLCPLGAIFALVSKLRITSIKKSRENCGKCRCCTNSCPMGIALYQKDTVKSGECIECFHCISACPRKNVTLAVTGNDVRPMIASTAAVASIAGLYYAGSFAATMLGSSPTSVQTSSVSAVNKTYNDGTYTGEGNGFRGITSVSVTIKNDEITDIKILSFKDDSKFFNRAYPTIIQAVKQKQSIDIDTVSGATYSSLGILKAVKNALDKAKIAVNSNTTAAVSSTSTSKTNSSTAAAASLSETTATAATTATAKYKDGTFQGSGNGFRGTTTVSVTVQNASITDIKILSYKDDDRFFNSACMTIIQSVKSKQSANVDTVSGATYSSRGILQAVSNALKAAT